MKKGCAKGCLTSFLGFLAFIIVVGACSPDSETTSNSIVTDPNFTSEQTYVSTVEPSLFPSTESPSITPTTEVVSIPNMQPTTEVVTEPPHVHSFSDATCTSPKTCSCGATEGSANSHAWIEATCTEPKKCSICGTTSGLTAGHTFSDGKCTSCGKNDPDYEKVMMVWIPTNGGTKYHSSAGCSNMIDPVQVTQSEAESRGFTPCKRCH